MWPGSLRLVVHLAMFFYVDFFFFFPSGSGLSPGDGGGGGFAVAIFVCNIHPFLNKLQTLTF